MHPNEEMIRKAWQVFGQGDMTTLRNEYFTEDATLHMPGTSPVAGDYVGVDNALGFFGKLFQLTNGTYRSVLHDVVANDEHIVALHTATGDREGRPALAMHEALVCHVRDGKVAELWIHPWDLNVVEAFFS
jgi:ketosteroid isomerase-like protein